MDQESNSNWIDALPAELLAEISLWSADLVRLSEDICRTQKRADLFHIDVADGHFSSAMLFFPDIVNAIHKTTDVPLHIHLMVSDSIIEEQIDQFANAGASLISFHLENSNVQSLIDLIHSYGIAAGLVLSLQTSVSEAIPYLDTIQWITLICTEIGVKGRDMDPAATQRIEEAKALIKDAPNSRVRLAADGGIREHTVPLLRKAGVQSVVMGSLAFAADDFNSRIDWIKSL